LIEQMSSVARLATNKPSHSSPSIWWRLDYTWMR
jgi:hypothetical protein